MLRPGTIAAVVYGERVSHCKSPGGISLFGGNKQEDWKWE